MGRVCNGQRLSWAEFVVGRDVLEPSRVSLKVANSWIQELNHMLVKRQIIS